MTSITLDSIDERLAACLSARAAQHGRSVEEEIVLILQEQMPQQEVSQGRDAGQVASRPKGLGRAIRDLFADVGGVELELPPRELMSEPPRFE